MPIRSTEGDPVRDTEARERLTTARVARLATVDRAGRPHLVPIVFALSGETIVSAVDFKPKRTKALKRLSNIGANPRVSVLVDEYDEEWSRLWWVRVDGSAQVLPAADAEAGLASLVEKYPQYHSSALDGPVIVITIDKVVGWSGSD